MAKRRIVRPRDLAPIGRQRTLPTAKAPVYPCNEKGTDEVVKKWKDRGIRGRLAPGLGERPSIHRNEGDQTWNLTLVRRYRGTTA